MCNPISWFSHFLSAIGAINWGLVAFFKFNLVEYVADMVKVPYLGEVLYLVIAIAGAYSLFSLFSKKA